MGVCKLGLIFSISLLVLLSIIASWSANQIIRAKILTKSTTYEETCLKLLGFPGYWVLNVTLWLNYLCVMGMYVCFSVKFIFPFFDAISETLLNSSHYNIIIVGMFFLYIPVLLLDDLSVLGLSSAIGMFSVMILIILSTIACPLDKQLDLSFVTDWRFDYGLHKDTDFFSFLTNFGILFMVNNCHFSVSSIQNSLTDR